MDRYSPWSFTRSLFVLLAFLLALLVPLTFAGQVAPLAPGPDDRCPVCGMRVAPFPDWLAQVQYRDGSAFFFDGPKDLFKYLRFPEKYAGSRSNAQLVAVFVTSYYDHTPLIMESAWYVIGSDVTGPMGAELVPHASREDAEEFMRDHGGTAVLRASEVTAEVLQRLR